MSVNDLVKRFAEISMAQAEALEWDEIGEFNRLYTQLDRVGREIQRRGSEDRTKLKGLYLHPSPQVRLNAAKSTLAIAPQEAREVLESICASRRLPQSLDAGMTLSNLDSGIFKPT